jgi:hypothetical protein
MEVTFEEARAHIGIEMQRQWSGGTIARVTPVLWGLFALVTGLADRLVKRHTMSACAAAWYTKAGPTCAEAMALVRHRLWSGCHYSTSRQRG